MSTADWFRLIVKEFRRGRKTVYIPTDDPVRLRARLRYYKRKNNTPMRFVKGNNTLMVIRL